jgi:hypothetical protein
MTRLLIAFALFAALSDCSQSHGQAWRASDENGDKPGIGYELRVENGAITGTAYILDPNFPHDFSHGRHAAMRIMRQSPQEITFRVEWDRDLGATLRFQFKEAAWPDSFQAVVTELIDSEPYNPATYTFARVK